MSKILIYGYGNPGRYDDGLGVAFVDRLEAWAKDKGLDHVSFDTNYQLNIEDAELISNYEEVLFVDASLEQVDQFKVEDLTPNNSKIEFSMHAVSPSFVLDLCYKMYERRPKASLMHIKGIEWQFEEGLSEPAKENLEIALKWSKNWLQKKPVPFI